MSFCQLHWSSAILGKQTTTWILLPDHGTPPFATFYLLHGLSDDHTAWMRHTRINDYVANLPLIVVMPDGGRGYYTDNASGPRWATHLAEELPATIERNFPAKTNRAGRCVGGLSMGGYGAMRLALGYPDRYISANSHSARLMGPKADPAGLSVNEYQHIIGNKYKGSQHDLAMLAQRANAQKQLPKLRIDCGTEDFALKDTREFHRLLVKMNVVHEYEEFPGNHNWDYWEIHVREALKFHSGVLGIGQ